MAKTVDLRTYLLLERAFVRRLQRAWRIQSAPLYARITQACLDHKWDEARRLVTFLDMTEVGTQNREWITYMLLSFATFGAQTVAKKKPSFVGVGTFDRFLKQVTNNIIQYLEFTATAKIQEDALHLIATDEANTKAQKRDYVRDEKGRFASYLDPFGKMQYPIDSELANIRSDTSVYRGITQDELDSIERTGEIKSTQRYSVPGEGTNFGEDFATAQSYINASRDNPALTGRETHVIEVTRGDDIVVDRRDFYPKAAAAIPADRITRIWTFSPDGTVRVRTRKWEESEHPRDRAGKFTEGGDAGDPAERLKVVRSLADEVAHQMGFDPSRIDVVDEEAKGFSVGEKQFTEAGHYDPTTGRIYLNSANITYDETPLVKGVISHEISHAIFHELKEAAKVEEQAFLKLAMTPTDQYSDWYLERFSLQKGPSGRTERRPKPEYVEELARDYPASTVLSALGDGYFKGISRKMVEENGHSEYAKTYWDPKALEGRDFNQKYDHAITETIAEITRYVTKSGWYEMTKPSPDSPWVKLTVAMHQWYQNRPKAA